MKSLYVLLALLLLLNEMNSFGQTVVFNDGTTLMVEANGLLFLEGQLQNENGLLENHGEIQLTGDWINLAQYEASNEGKVTFQGKLPSLVQGNLTGNNSFYLLEIQKDGINLNDQLIILMDDAEIQGELLLGAGRIETDIYQLYISNSDPLAITGYQTGGSMVQDRYIQGNLKRKLSQSGGVYDFPLGEDPQSGFAYNLATVDFSSLSADMELMAVFQGSKMTISDTLHCTDAYLYPLDCRYGEWVFQDDGMGTSYLYDIQLFPNMTFACDSAIYQIVEADQSYLGDCPAGNGASSLSSFHSFNLVSGKDKMMATSIDPLSGRANDFEFWMVNPVRNGLIIGSLKSKKHQKISLKLYDLSGKYLGLLWEGVLINNAIMDLEIPLRHLARGHYLIIIEGEFSQNHQIFQLD